MPHIHKARCTPPPPAVGLRMYVSSAGPPKAQDEHTRDQKKRIFGGVAMGAFHYSRSTQTEACSVFLGGGYNLVLKKEGTLWYKVLVFPSGLWMITVVSCAHISACSIFKIERTFVKRQGLVHIPLPGIHDAYRPMLAVLGASLGGGR